MRNYIIFSTLFCVFASDNLFYRSSFNDIDIRLYYFIFLINFSILFAKGSFEFNKKHLLFLCVLAISGSVGIILDSMVLPRFLMSLWGISYVSSYYYLFFRKTHISYETMFKYYTIGCVIFTIIGYFEFLYHLLIDGHLIRFDSFATEASVYCTLVLPSFHYFLQRALHEKKYFLELFCIFSGIILSLSSLGLIGILISIFLSVKKWRFVVIIPLITVSLFFIFAAYTMSDQVQRRADSAISIINKKDDISSIESLNQSSFFLLANTYVAFSSANTTYGFGHGLGSHSVTYQKTIESILDINKLGEDYQRVFLDANSLFNRILSDLGYWGIIASFIFLRKYRIRDPGIHQIISRAILVTICCRLIRDGRYFNADLFFFISGYIVIYLEKYGPKKKIISKSING